MSADSKYNCRHCSSVCSGWARSGAERGSQRRQRQLQLPRLSNNISELRVHAYILAALAVNDNIKLAIYINVVVGVGKRNLHAKG